MSTITAILDVDSDGSVHLPLPADLRRGKVKVVATLTPVSENDPVEGGMNPLRRLASRGGLKSIPDPVLWQQDIRQERPLPGREE